MKKIGLLSDTHNYLDPLIFSFFESCDEIWHAGDFGTAAIADSLQAFKPLRGVYGNIDGPDIRNQFPKNNFFSCEGVNVLMIHIGGYPPKYNPESKKEIALYKPQLFISGHSHILKIMYDNKIGCLHINPGAAGRQGWHKIPTIVRFVIEGNDIRDCEVMELEKPRLI